MDHDPSKRLQRRPDHLRADILATIAVGGAIGATLRYLLARALPHAAGTYPAATFITNTSGAFVLGFLVVLSIERLPPNRYLRPFLATGVIGAFTTFSTFAMENVQLTQGGHAALAALYLVATLLAGGIAAFAGIACARAVPAARRGGAMR